MNSTRRGFLGALAAMVAAPVVAEVDTDRLLWVPGAKLISIPKPPTTDITYEQFHQRYIDAAIKVWCDEIDRIAMHNFQQAVLDGWSGWGPHKKIGDTIIIRRPQRF